MPEPEPAEPESGALEFVYTEIASAFDRQSDALDKVDAKTVVVVGYAIAAAAFLSTQHFKLWLGLPALAAFGISVWRALAAYWIRDYKDVEPRGLFGRYHQTAKPEALRRLAATRVQHYEVNANHLNAKVSAWKQSLAALLAGTLLMVTAILVHTVSHDSGKETSSPATRQIREAAPPPGPGRARPTLSAVRLAGRGRGG